jgi:hypothetical protein
MRALASSDVLGLWERGSRLHPVDRGLLALGEALPGTSYESLADWPLGHRNRALAELRCALFGPRLEGWTSCARCGERLEFQMDARSLAAADTPPPSDPGPAVAVGGHSFRLPTSRDLAHAARETDPRTAAVRILEACRLEEGESPVWSDRDIDEAGEQMALADPMAETRLTLNCPTCGSQWDETLDVAAFLWTEIEARAKRLLLEVHTLASAYGWTENDILSLSEPRRASYLEVVRS